MNENPLSKYYRQPQLYIKLPSKGLHYPKDALELTATGEYPVYAMTAKDELTFKTPDALLNGQSTVDVIQSCVPNIKNAWQMPAIDLDTVLISIRQATYGNEMEFTAVCSHCNTQDTYAVDLSVLKDGIKSLDYNEPIKIDDLAIKIKPMNFQEFNSNSQEMYEQQRLIAIAADQTMTEDDKLTQFHVVFKKLINFTVGQLANNIQSITIDDQTVTDRQQINEFLENCDKILWNKIKDAVDKKIEFIKSNELNILCNNQSCQKSFKTPLLFEQSSFFG